MALASEPDPEFVRSLRNRLTGEAQPGKSPRESFRERLPAWARRYWVPVGALAAAAAVALIVVLGSNRSTGPGSTSTQSAFAVPTPGRADVTRSYPSAGGLGGGNLQVVWYSYLQPPPGAPYAGRLTLQGQPLPGAPKQASAYRLDAPRFDLPRLRALARTLGIIGPLRHMTVEHDRWAFVAQRTNVTLHSIAINVVTGELVYHHTFQSNAPNPAHVTNAQITAARAWLSKLGWPASSMPVRRPATEQEALFPWVVRFNWSGVAADVPAASVSLDTSGRVTEAVLEPPIDATTRITLASRQDAWNALKRSGGPIGVEGMIGQQPLPGTATLAGTQLIDVLTRSANGRSYLVPSYRFQGRATIQSVRATKRWIAIVPAVK